MHFYTKCTSSTLWTFSLKCTLRAKLILSSNCSFILESALLVHSALSIQSAILDIVELLLYSDQRINTDIYMQSDIVISCVAGSNWSQVYLPSDKKHFTPGINRTLNLDFTLISLISIINKTINLKNIIQYLILNN